MTPQIGCQVILGPSAVAEYQLRTLHRWSSTAVVLRWNRPGYDCWVGGVGFGAQHAAEAIGLAYEFARDNGLFPKRCACGQLDSPNHRAICWQAPR